MRPRALQEGREAAASIGGMDPTHSLESVSDDELLRRLVAILEQSRRTEADLVLHIGEVDARRLYGRQASPSMFVYCTERLHLGGGLPAHRRRARVPGASGAPGHAGRRPAASHGDRQARPSPDPGEPGPPARTGGPQVQARDRRARATAGRAGPRPEAAGAPAGCSGLHGSSGRRLRRSGHPGATSGPRRPAKRRERAGRPRPRLGPL